MEIEDFNINKVKSRDRKGVVLSVRVSQKDSEWMRENKVSPSKLFNYILHKVMKQEK